MTSTDGAATDIFNFEGGCYAKAIKLSREAEPEIYATTERFGTVHGERDAGPRSRGFPTSTTNSKTENTRIAYPLEFIANASTTGRAGHPKNIIMLTCDAFGVLPPIAKLDAAQAMYHFLSGYTAKVAGTEKGVTEPQATFSTCFGAPFLPLHPTVYGNLLRDTGRAPPCRLLARQHRMDRRQVRRRKAHADPGDAPPGRGGARRLPAIARISAPTPISASLCPCRFQASSPTSSNRSRPGATRPSSPKSPGAWCKCSATISSSSRVRPTSAYAPPARRRASLWLEGGIALASASGAHEAAAA